MRVCDLAVGTEYVFLGGFWVLLFWEVLRLFRGDVAGVLPGVIPLLEVSCWLAYCLFPLSFGRQLLGYIYIQGLGFLLFSRTHDIIDGWYTIGPRAQAASRLDGWPWWPWSWVQWQKRRVYRASSNAAAIAWPYTYLIYITCAPRVLSMSSLVRHHHFKYHR